MCRWVGMTDWCGMHLDLLFLINLYFICIFLIKNKSKLFLRIIIAISKVNLKLLVLHIIYRNPLNFLSFCQKILEIHIQFDFFHTNRSIRHYIWLSRNILKYFYRPDAVSRKYLRQKESEQHNFHERSDLWTVF